MKRPKVHIIVSFDLPENASREDALEYVRKAVSNWYGCLEPPSVDGGDPMFELDYKSVRVKFEPNKAMRLRIATNARKNLK